MKTPTNSDDILDSRDLQRLVYDLEIQYSELIADQARAGQKVVEYGSLENKGEYRRKCEARENWEKDNLSSLVDLRHFFTDIENSLAAEYGITLIRSTYFIDHVKSMAADYGFDEYEIPAWIREHLTMDWGGLADTIRGDYSSMFWGGVMYWYRE